MTTLRQVLGVGEIDEVKVLDSLERPFSASRILEILQNAIQKLKEIEGTHIENLMKLSGAYSVVAWFQLIV
jgi:hypothetical protein